MTPRYFIGFKLCSELKPYRTVFQAMNLLEIPHNETTFVVYPLETHSSHPLSKVIETFQRLEDSLKEHRHEIPKRLTHLQLFQQLYIGEPSTHR